MVLYYTRYVLKNCIVKNIDKSLGDVIVTLQNKNNSIICRINVEEKNKFNTYKNILKSYKKNTNINIEIEKQIAIPLYLPEEYTIKNTYK